MRIINVDQNSEEWFHEREGKITGSRAEATFVSRIANKSTMVDIIHDISGEDKKELNKLKLHELEERLPEDIKKDFYHQAQKKEYYQLLAEKLGYTDADEDGIYEDPRERGHRLEDTAAEFLEKEYDVKTVKVGMCARDDWEDIAISPDRMIVREGSVIELDEDGYILNVETVKFEGGAEIKNPGVRNHLEIILTNKVPSEYYWQVVQYFVVTDIDYLYFVSHNPNVTAKPLHVIRIERKDVAADVEISLNNQINTLKHLNEDVLSLTF